MQPNKTHINRLYKILGISSNEDISVIAKKIGIKKTHLQYFNDQRILPTGLEKEKILKYLNVSEGVLKIKLGIIDRSIIEWIADNPDLIPKEMILDSAISSKEFAPVFSTEHGSLFNADCIEYMRTIENDSIDLVFADPPFNLGKVYDSGMDDNLSEDEYLKWTEEWLIECIRILKPGGSFFVYNLPKWLIETSHILNNYLNFRHWISFNFRGYTPPIKWKLNITHYGMLYYVKGERPTTFNTQRLPMKTCRHCGGEIHSYGGKKKSVPINGQVISDVWEDIHPIRHKGRKNRDANELPLKLLLRVVSLASNEGDVVFDPFGGSGTTYKAAQMLNRKWLGTEIGDFDTIKNRLIDTNGTDKKVFDEFLRTKDITFTEEQRKLRKSPGEKKVFWLPEDFE